MLFVFVFIKKDKYWPNMTFKSLTYWTEEQTLRQQKTCLASQVKCTWHEHSHMKTSPINFSLQQQIVSMNWPLECYCETHTWKCCPWKLYQQIMTAVPRLKCIQDHFKTCKNNVNLFKARLTSFWYSSTVSGTLSC